MIGCSSPTSKGTPLAGYPRGSRIKAAATTWVLRHALPLHQVHRPHSHLIEPGASRRRIRKVSGKIYSHLHYDKCDLVDLFERTAATIAKSAELRAKSRELRRKKRTSGASSDCPELPADDDGPAATAPTTIGES